MVEHLTFNQVVAGSNPARPTIASNPHSNSHRLCGDRNRPVVVLVHGVGLGRFMWREVDALLARDFCVLSYDLIGHGDCPDWQGARGFDDYVAQLAHLTDHLGIDSFGLVGFSLGALIARAAAATLGARLTHLAFLHGVYQRNADERRAVQARCRLARDEGASASLEASLARWFSPHYRAAHGAVIDEIRAAFARHGEGYQKAYQLFADGDVAIERYPLARLRALARPMLVLTGFDDPGAPPRMARGLHQQLPGSRLIVNRAHRHLAPLEHPRIIAAQLGEFLRDG